MKKQILSMVLVFAIFCSISIGVFADSVLGDAVVASPGNESDTILIVDSDQPWTIDVGVYIKNTGSTDVDFSNGEVGGNITVSSSISLKDHTNGLWSVSSYDDKDIIKVGGIAPSAKAVVQTYSYAITFSSSAPGLDNNKKSDTITIKITVPAKAADTTPPTISWGLPSPAANSYGWNNTSVSITYTCADDSGIKSVTPASPLVFNGEGANQTQDVTAVDNANNSATFTSPIVNIDKTAPSIDGAAASNPNENGWYKNNVTVNYTYSDSLSGISDETSTIDKVISVEGVDLSSTHTVFDKAGNSASASVTGIKIDKTAPSITINGIENGGTYILNTQASWNAEDALSGLATDASGIIDTSKVGSKSVDITATDAAGNTAKITLTYKIIYNFSGFFKPIEMGEDAVNTIKAGSAVPIKFSLDGDMGLSVFSLGYPKAIVGVFDSNADYNEVETIDTAGKSSLSYDSITDQYTYVWKTEKAWAGTSKVLVVRFIDGTVYTANFQLKK